MPIDRHRLPALGFGLGLLVAAHAAPVFAGQPDGATPAAIAAPDKVYPPLPSLAMLPPGDGGEVEPVRAVSGKKRVLALRGRKHAEPMVRMVVSDASHAYLASIEQQLDQAMQK